MFVGDTVTMFMPELQCISYKDVKKQLPLHGCSIS